MFFINNSFPETKQLIGIGYYNFFEYREDDYI